MKISDIRNITFQTQAEATTFFAEQALYGKPYKFVYTIDTDPSKVYYIDETVGSAILLGSGAGGAVLFPNGFEDVLESRDFQHSDVGKALRLAADDVFLTMPEGQFWTEEEKGQVIIVIADAINVGYDRTFELPVLMQGRDEANSLVGEYSMLITGETDGQSDVATISSAVLKDGDDWKTAIRYFYDNLGGGSSSLFPNGIEFVNASRDFQASDAGKRLFVSGENTVISMPEVNPFAVGDYVGIINDGDNISFTTEYGGEPIFSLKTGDGTTSECVVLMNTEVEGSSWLFPISTSFEYDNTDSKKKTALKYLYDKSQDAIPLSGTVSGSPVTGDIEMSSDNFLFYNNGTGKSGIVYDADGVRLINVDSATEERTYIASYADKIRVVSDVSGSVGLSGANDFTANIGALDYTQKIYVGFRGTATLSSGTVTVSTDKILTGYKIYISVNTPSGTQGFLSASTADIIDATSFVINSTSVLDNSTVNWWIVPNI